MGCIIVFSSFLSVLVFIPGQRGLVWKTIVPSEPIKEKESMAIEEVGTSLPKIASSSVASKESETNTEESSDEHVSIHSDTDATQQSL